MSPGARLLVLDDDPTIGAFVRFSVGSEFDVAVASSAADFLARVADWQPSCVIVDLEMPDMHGVEVIRALAASDFSAKLVLMSAAEESELAVARDVAQSSGLDLLRVLPKPPRQQQLVALLREA